MLKKLATENAEMKKAAAELKLRKEELKVLPAHCIHFWLTIRGSLRF